MAVSVNFGMIMPSWFDIYGLSESAKEDTDGIKKAAKQCNAQRYPHYSERITDNFVAVQTMVEDEIKGGIPSKQIILGGFSQGGSLALYTALTMETELAGVLALSSWLPLHKSFPGAIKGNRDVPVLQCHGEADPVVPLVWGKQSADFLSPHNPNHKFKSYPGLPHSSSQEELEDVRAFINKHLPKTD
jgi:lysophospholipase-2